MPQYFPACIHVLLVGINFFLVLFFAWKSRRIIAQALREIPLPYYAGLAGIGLALALLYFFVISPKHYMGEDFMFEEAAKNVLTRGDFGALMKSQGWAFLISLGYLLAGVNNYVSIYLSEILGTAAVFVFFLLAVWFGADRYGAFLSTLIFAFLPARIFWSATGESHTALLFFVILAMAFSFLFYRKPEKALFWLALMAWSFAVQVRGETIFLSGLFFLGIRLFLPEDARRKIPYMPGLLIFACLAIPQLLVGEKFYSAQLLIAEHSHRWGGSSFFIFHNLKVYLPQFLLGMAHPLILSLMAGAGMVELRLRDKKLFYFLIAWFAVLTMVYFSMWLDIYGGGKGLFPKMRLLMFFYPPLLLFFSYSMGSLVPLVLVRKIILGMVVCGGIIFWSIPYYQRFLSNDYYHSMEAQMKIIDYAEHSALREDTIISCSPSVFTATTSLSAVNAYDFLNNPVLRGSIFADTAARGGKVLFFETFLGKGCQESGIEDKIIEGAQAVVLKTFFRGNAQRSILWLRNSF